MNQHRKIVIDESIQDSQIEKISNILKRDGIDRADFLFIAKEHPGMPDYEIIHFLLNESTVFITNDRPLHNTVLDKGYKSFYVDGDRITAKRLEGIRTIKLPKHIKKDLQPKDNYHEPKTEIRHLLLPKSNKSLKKLQTKRRRIRNYFGGTDNMSLAAITVSYKPLGSSILVGTRIKISSDTGVKALDASESYVEEKVDFKDGELVALSNALILAIHLMLNHVRTIVYYDGHKITNPDQYFSGNAEQHYQFVFQKLTGSFTQIEFTSSTKGFFIERLRKKLDNLAVRNTNEILPGRIAEIEKAIHQFYAYPEPRDF